MKRLTLNLEGFWPYLFFNKNDLVIEALLLADKGRKYGFYRKSKEHQHLKTHTGCSYFSCAYVCVYLNSKTANDWTMAMGTPQSKPRASLADDTGHYWLSASEQHE